MDLYHLVNRGVEGRELFLDTRDYARFVHDMYEFNDTAPAGNSYRAFSASPLISFSPNQHKMMDIVSPSSRLGREQIVDIHAWCLMKNHYHLLVSERIEGGLSMFIRKLNVGYAKYFNERYERIGTLFQGRTKKILIERDQQFNYILHYIHLNPLDYLKGAKEWRIRSKRDFKNPAGALKYLETYRWSSYLDYVGRKNFPSVLTTSFFGDAFGNYSKAIRTYLQERADAENSIPVAFE